MSNANGNKELLKIFDQFEEKELRDALEGGGVLVTIYNDPDLVSTILKSDNKGGYTLFCKLSRKTSLKLYELLSGCWPTHFFMVSLSWIIDKYC